MQNRNFLKCGMRNKKCEMVQRHGKMVEGIGNVVYHLLLPSKLFDLNINKNNNLWNKIQLK
jgi:hypothetical protein